MLRIYQGSAPVAFCGPIAPALPSYTLRVTALTFSTHMHINAHVMVCSAFVDFVPGDFFSCSLASTRPPLSLGDACMGVNRSVHRLCPAAWCADEFIDPINSIVEGRLYLGSHYAASA
eukprot:RCo041262